MAEPILLARNAGTECFLLPEMANRHGLVTGATGTGKTVTLQTLAEAFSRRGVPVFMADVKGDLAGITQPGAISPKLAAVLKERGIEPQPPAACPATLWDVYADGSPPPGRPKADDAPSGGSERSERGGRFIPCSAGARRPSRASCSRGRCRSPSAPAPCRTRRGTRPWTA